MFARISLFIVFSLLPLVAFAQVVFTEVMYDLETGSDTGREWVEVQNTGGTSVDISGYRLREGTTNHTLIISQGNASLAPLGVAIIADNPAKFLVDNPNFLGTIFDSSFSLGNTGETLVLKDSSLVDVDKFTYSSDMGANGDGKSLQKSAGSWISALPTPGIVASNQVSSASGESSSSASSTSTDSPVTTSSSTQDSSSVASGSSSKWPVKPQIYAYAGEDKKVTVGTPAGFEGQALGIEKKPLENARYLWSFGDGGMAEGKRVIHTYHYPGVYVAVLDASSAEFSSADKLIVTVISAELSFHSEQDSLGGFVEIENLGKEEVDISYWQLVASSSIYTFPKDTLLLPSHKVLFPRDITGLLYEPYLELHYPNGWFALKSSLLSEGVLSSVKSAVSKNVTQIEPKQIKKIEDVPREFVSASVLNTRVSTASSSQPKPIQKLNYKWLYALAGLLGVSTIAVLWVGAPKEDEDIEIIEDPS